MLRTDYLDGGFVYKADALLHPEGQMWFYHVFIHDSLHNKKNLQTLLVRIGVPWLEPYLKIAYQLDHSTFKFLTPNYYSYKNQIMQYLRGELHIDFYKKAFFDAAFEHRWKNTRNLIQPIGDFIFIASSQYLIVNQVSAKAGYRFQDKMVVDAEGYYYHDSLPETYWGVKGSFLWQF